MRLVVFPSVLKRGVGRRIFVMFLLAAILPLIFTAMLASYELQRSAEIDASETLRQHAKSYGVAVLSRIQAAADNVHTLANLASAYGGDAGQLRSFVGESTAAAYIMDSGGGVERIRGIPGRSPLLTTTTFEFDDSDLVRFEFIRSGNIYAPTFWKTFDAADGNRHLLTIQLKADALWGSAEERPYNTDFCLLLPGGGLLHCSETLTSVDSATISNDPLAVLAEWSSNGEEYVSTTWQLFLAAKFGSPSLNIVAIQPLPFALNKNTDVAGIFLPVTVMVLLLVGMLSFRVIAQNLRPLRQLTRATERIANGDLRTQVNIESADEFEALGTAFNKMTGRIGLQLGVLEAMAELDRMIMSRASFLAVCDAVAKHLRSLTGCESVAVLASSPVRSESSQSMVFIGPGGSQHVNLDMSADRIQEIDAQEVLNLDMDPLADDPCVTHFKEVGSQYLLVTPVESNDQNRGVIYLGADNPLTLSPRAFSICKNFADRFAVAMASFERANELYVQANFDDLTGLPNRQLMKERLRTMLSKARLQDTGGALFYLDLDRFKEINDVYGHSVGDSVLRQTADRIVAEMNEAHTVSRLGGDEFVVLIPDTRGQDEVKQLAARLLERLTEVFAAGGTNHYVGASIGIVMFPDDGDSVEMLLKNADAAMYRAKDQGRSRFEFFNEYYNAVSRRKVTLERDLRAAFARHELNLVYQPQFVLESGELAGAEALVRWDHPQLGSVSPAEFVPLAEESDLIVDIGRWVIEETCRNIRQIVDKGLHPGAVAVNISARQLLDSRLCNDVLESLEHSRLHPAYLKLEVTETAVAQNRDVVTEVLGELRKHGVQIALDDFGTGYSSLSYLQDLPFDTIKIDKSFVDNIANDDNAVRICSTIVQMAKQLNKTAVAEGVETAGQADFLRERGCELVQGYLYSKPLALQEFVAFVRKQDFHTRRRRALELV